MVQNLFSFKQFDVPFILSYLLCNILNDLPLSVTHLLPQFDHSRTVYSVFRACREVLIFRLSVSFQHILNLIILHPRYSWMTQDLYSVSGSLFDRVLIAYLGYLIEFLSYCTGGDLFALAEEWWKAGFDQGVLDAGFDDLRVMSISDEWAGLIAKEIRSSISAFGATCWRKDQLPSALERSVFEVNDGWSCTFTNSSRSCFSGNWNRRKFSARIVSTRHILKTLLDAAIISS